MHRGGGGLPEVTHMCGKCRGCVYAYLAEGGSVPGAAATSGAVYDNYATLGF
jgi:hypothetical protein